MAKGARINDEEEKSKHRALRHTLVEMGRGGIGIFDGDKLLSVGNVGLEPGESSTGESEIFWHVIH